MFSAAVCPVCGVGSAGVWRGEGWGVDSRGGDTSMAGMAIAIPWVLNI